MASDISCHTEEVRWAYHGKNYQGKARLLSAFGRMNMSWEGEEKKGNQLRKEETTTMKDKQGESDVLHWTFLF